MTEQKGSYAHVGLPGLRELFAQVEAKKHGLSNEEAIQAIKANYPPESYTVLREALDMAMDALQQLTKKDATIKELQEEVKKWKTLAEAKILFVSDGNNERMWEYQEDNIALRKALEIQQNYLMELREVTPYELYREQITNVLKESNSALREGDKK